MDLNDYLLPRAPVEDRRPEARQRQRLVRLALDGRAVSPYEGIPQRRPMQTPGERSTRPIPAEEGMPPDEYNELKGFGSLLRYLLGYR